MRAGGLRAGIPDTLTPEKRKAVTPVVRTCRSCKTSKPATKFYGDADVCRACHLSKRRTKRKLKVVDETDVPDPEPEPEPVKPTSLREAVELGERELLVMMRTQVATELDNGVAAAYFAATMRQLRELDKEIRMFDLRKKQEADEDGIAPDEPWDEEAL